MHAGVSVRFARAGTYFLVLLTVAALAPRSTESTHREECSTPRGINQHREELINTAYSPCYCPWCTARGVNARGVDVRGVVNARGVDVRGVDTARGVLPVVYSRCVLSVLIPCDILVDSVTFFS